MTRTVRPGTTKFWNSLGDRVAVGGDEVEVDDGGVGIRIGQDQLVAVVERRAGGAGPTAVEASLAQAATEVLPASTACCSTTAPAPADLDQRSDEALRRPAPRSNVMRWPGARPRTGRGDRHRARAPSVADLAVERRVGRVDDHDRRHRCHHRCAGTPGQKKLDVSRSVQRHVGGRRAAQRGESGGRGRFGPVTETTPIATVRASNTATTSRRRRFTADPLRRRTDRRRSSGSSSLNGTER